MRYSLLLTAVGIMGTFTYTNLTATCGCNGPEDVDGDTYCVPDDCDDTNPDTFPGAPEVCDGKDNDCDGSVPVIESDADKDGVTACGGDCDDNNAAVKPGATEICDGKDNNCDGALGATEVDADGDGSQACAGDCNDSDPDIYPGAAEQCDGLDNNCDGAIPAEETDSDGDGYTSCNGDCDDTNKTIFPGATEICDGADQNCDGLSDVTSDGSTAWQRSVCAAVLAGTTGSYDAVGIDHPSVIYNQDLLKFQAWYRATDASKVARIGYAESTNGVSWTKNSAAVLNPGASGAWDAKALAFPSVVYKDGAYVMYYHGQDSSNKLRIGRATSPDGKVWTKDATFVMEATATTTWEAKAVSSPSVLFDADENLWKMWYTGSDGTTLRTGYASSADGKVWTKNANYVVGAGGTGTWDSKRVVFARVHKEKGLYHMFYSGDDINNTFTYEIGYATSTDGINWTKLDDPVFSFSTTGQFDSFMVYSAEVIPSFDAYSMYYSGAISLDGPYAVGVARNAQPYASLVAPQPGSVSRVGERVEFALDVEDLGHKGLVTAYFFDSVDGMIGVSTSYPGSPLVFATNELTPGEHTVHAVVLDNGGLMSHETVDISVF